jgi:hypothetical protein
MDASDIEYQEREQNEVEEDGLAVELAVLSVIAARLRKVDESTTYAIARAWQAEDMGAIARLLSAGAQMLTGKSNRVMDGMGESSDEWAKPFFEARGIAQTSVFEDESMGAALKSGKVANARNVASMCRTSVLSLVAPDGTVRRVDEAYKAILDSAIQSIMQGDAAYTKAIGRAVWQLSKGGLRVMYPSGSTRELYAAVSMNVMDGFRLTMQDIRDQQAQRFKAAGSEVSAHGMCAEDHLPYQGRQYTRAGFERIQQRLRRPIGKGMNCRHMVTGVVLGVSSNAYTEEQRRAMVRESRRKTGVKTASGHDMTAYEFSQWQRRSETEIRKLKAQARLHEKAGLDPREFEREADAKRREYVELSKKAGVETRLERTRVYEWKLKG